MMKMGINTGIRTIAVCVSCLLLSVSCKKNGDEATVKDADGNVYNTVMIGNQLWFKENLKTTKLNDGTLISSVADNAAWTISTTPTCCLYDNIITNKGNYGVLYNWYAVESSKLCPEGWHVPSESELAELFDFLGGKPVAGGKLKATGTVENGDGLWRQPNTGATNASGFSALPGGFRNSNGLFFDFGYSALCWSATECSPDKAYPFWLNHNEVTVGDNSTGWVKGNGLSVRCLKD